MKLPRFRVATLVLLVAILALSLASVIQDRRSSVREEMMKAEIERLEAHYDLLTNDRDEQLFVLKKAFAAYKKEHP
jgi:hypothetical protein